LTVVGLALVCGWLYPGSLLAKKTIDEEELDRVNAAGVCHPQGATCEGTAVDQAAQADKNAVAQEIGAGLPSGSSSGSLTLTNAQQAINALAVNNVSGLNQVASGINVSGAAGFHR
jgi:hypothetical protein